MGLLIRAGKQNRFVKEFDRPIRFDKPGRQPVQQLWMRGWQAADAKISTGRYDPAAKVMLPMIPDSQELQLRQDMQAKQDLCAFQFLQTDRRVQFWGYQISRFWIAPINEFLNLAKKNVFATVSATIERRLILRLPP